MARKVLSSKWYMRLLVHDRVSTSLLLPSLSHPYFSRARSSDSRLESELSSARPYWMTRLLVER
jgi:hypothetical protein